MADDSIEAPDRSASQRRRRTLSGVVALARGRVRGTGTARLASVLGVVVGGGFAAVALIAGRGEGDGAVLLASEGRALVWAVGLPFAIAAASDFRSRDRFDGIEALAAARGVSPRGLETARMLASMAQAALAIGAPLALVAFINLALAGSVRAAFARVAGLLAAAAFALLAGATLGGVGSACARFGRDRGPRLMAAIFLVPWLVAEAFGHASVSLPGALDAALRFTLGVGPGGGA